MTQDVNTIFTVWRSQADADSMLVDLEAQTAVTVIFGELAEVGIGGGVSGQALFEFGVVGVDFSSAVVFVEVEFGDFSLLLGDLFHKTFLSSVHFPGSRGGKSGLKSDSEAWNDVLVVPGFSVGYKVEFTGSGYFPWSGRLLSVPRW